MKLNENWKFVYEGALYPAKVPGVIHTDLYANGLIEDPFYSDNEKRLQWIDKKDWMYVCEFEVNQEFLQSNNQFLTFCGLDTYAQVLLNHQEILNSENMFISYEVNVSGKLREKNKLEIIFTSPINHDYKKIEQLGYNLPASNDISNLGEVGNDKLSVHARKAPYHYGWDWGPRFVTSGIYKDILLQTYEDLKISNVYYNQIHQADGYVLLEMEVLIDSFIAGETHLNLTLDQQLVIDEKVNLTVGKNTLNYSYLIEEPKLWWPNGFGEAYLYEINLKVGSQLDSQKIGLRTIELVRENDNFGQSFLFRVNGQDIFMKGANHIPNDSFTTDITKERYTFEIESAKASHFNMLRVWGGGIYEDEYFYQLCDESGILVWQDFMFACSMYPGDVEFLESVKEEAIYQVKRLRNHPSIAVWCGNNEIDSAWCSQYGHGWGWKQLYDQATRDKITETHDYLFYDLLNDITKKYDKQNSYWSSSPWTGDKYIHPDYESTVGDMHFWGVWHAKLPFSAYDTYTGRFVSEYGVQSFPNIETLEKIAPASELSLYSNTMLHHQRSGAGNEIIDHYQNEYFESCKDDFNRFVYQSQLSQGEAMRYAIEVHRRKKPYCMGSLYWQLNDTWPGPSWSSIDYYGNWKATQYFVKSACEDVIITYKESDHVFHFNVISDVPTYYEGKLTLSVKHINGDILKEEVIDLSIEANKSCYIKSFSKPYLLNGNDERDCYLHVALEYGTKVFDRNIHFTKVNKFRMRRPNVTIDVVSRSPREITFNVKADTFT
ncbi:MAG: beta-mannosidase, partial [Turicibacter sp.]